MAAPISERIAVMEAQLEQIEEDIKSDRAIASARTYDMELRLRSVEKTIAIGVGAIGLLQIVLKYL